jgi:hypothetical protein
MLLFLISAMGSSKYTCVLIAIVAAITIVDSQFVSIFYPTQLGIPGNLHLSLFISFVIVTSIINTILLLFARNNDSQASNVRPLLFKFAYIGTSAIQYTMLVILFIVIFQVVILHEYNKIFSLLIIYLSHLWSIVVLGILFFRFIQWFKFARAYSILIYGLVFGVILFLTLITVPFLTENFIFQIQFVFPRDYTSVILNPPAPSANMAFIYGLVNYVLPVLIVFSWLLTVSLLKQYAIRIGKKTFWLIASIPLLYQVFSFMVKDAGLVTDPAMVQIVYSRPFQFIFLVSYQVAGLFFAIAFLIVTRKIKRKIMRNYLIISCLGVILLFSSIQPGMPFYAVYPPFGLVTLLFLSLSSYMLLIGMLGCAAYVSRDTELRREIYRGLEVDSDMLKNIGMAETQREIERRVLSLADKIKLSDDMRERMDPSKEDVKTMIDEVLNEIHSMKSQIKSGEQQS